MFQNRSVVEIMVLIFVLVISFSIVSIGAVVAYVEIKDPTADTDDAVDLLSSAITIILGSLLGLLAGKSESGLSKRPDQEDK